MKKIHLALVLSLAANAALLVAFFARGPLFFVAETTQVEPSAGTSAHASDGGSVLAALASGDLDAMRAAGVPRDVVLRLAAARAFARMQALERAEYAPPSNDGRYWRNTPAGPPRPQRTPEQKMAREKAEREFNDAMHAAFGEDSIGTGPDRRFAFLPAATRDRLAQIEKDYNDLRSDVSRDIENIQLPSDEAKFKLLNQEQKRDVLAALSPDERAQFELRGSGTADTVRSRWGDAIQNEDDYKKIFALQKSFDAQFPADMYADGPPSPEVLRAREAASRQLEDDVRAVVGADSYAALQRANDPDYHILTALAVRLSLPAGTVDSAYATREDYSARSMQINADTILTSQQRSQQISALAAQVQSELTSKLGAEGADAYLKSSAEWYRWLKNGTAFSTSRNDSDPDQYHGDRNATVYPVPRKR